MKAKIQATTAILVGKSNVDGWCPVTGEPTNSIYQCFPTGKLVRASSDASALEAYNNELPNDTQILSPESRVSKPVEPAVWDVKQKIETKKVNNNITHLVAVVCRTLPATDNYPTRVKVTLPRYQKSVTLPWSHDASSPEVSDQVAFWLQQNNLKHCAFLDLHDHCVLAVEWELVPQLLELFKKKTPNRYKK
jgi:hypothetical protein